MSEPSAPYQPLQATTHARHPTPQPTSTVQRPRASEGPSWAAGAQCACSVVCPCPLAAQVASRAGLSYGFTLLYLVVVFVGGMLTFEVGLREEHSPTVPVIAQWVLFLCGPYVGAALIAAAMFLVEELTDDMRFELSDPDREGPLVYAMLCVNIACGFLFAFSLWYVDVQLRRRTEPRQLVDMCESMQVATCCPSCALCDMIDRARRNTECAACNFGPLDTLPEYPYENAQTASEA